MRKLLSLVVVLAMCLLGTEGFAVTSVTSTATVGLTTVLSVEFDTTNSTMSSTVSWTAVDASLTDIPPTGHLTTKPDIGLVCKSNHVTKGWYIQMSIVDVVGKTGLAGKIYKYIGQKPNLRDTGGTLGNGTMTDALGAWIVIPGSGGTIYTSGTNDSNNVANSGSFLGINLGLRPAGLGTGGTGYQSTITYTIVQGA